MISLSLCLALLTAVVWGANTREAAPSVTSTVDASIIITPQDNRNGWVNPEDLAPMPQCIAQQDQSTWLSALTQCTHKQCTRHFGVICTHHQWLTQLTCLDTAFSPEVIQGYFGYCDRSVLAKAQLYQWVRQFSSRTWLVNVGDANELQHLSPSSLRRGYSDIHVTYRAPSCLWRSADPRSKESFQSVIASCSFRSTSQHTGNAVRPWEYNEHLQSMVSLDTEEVGYDLVGGSVWYGEYFDKACFCSTFAIDWTDPICSGESVQLTRELLWMHATCGRSSVPTNWTDLLKTTEFAYIPVETWHWPQCVADMPEQILKLPKQCTTEACEIDSHGYCVVKRAVDRACFCRNIDYKTCGGSCQIFETRMDYIAWLHGLCGEVQDWHGLPHDWSQLAGPVPFDMIPWQWSLKPSNKSIIAVPGGTEMNEPAQMCASNEWKLGSLALVNIITILVVCFCRKSRLYQIISDFLQYWRLPGWFFTGFGISAISLFANWFNAVLVQNTLGYEHIPILALMHLWCSLPRMTWLPILLVATQPFEAIDFQAAMSSLFAEIILQAVSSYYMLITVSYGLEHSFYSGRLTRVDVGASARTMYFGAALWLVFIAAALVQLMWVARGMNLVHGVRSSNSLKYRGAECEPSNIAEATVAQVNERRALLDDHLAHRAMGTRPYWAHAERRTTTYGTLPTSVQVERVPLKALVYPWIITTALVIFLWISQWMFWVGFINVASEEYCPPNLVITTAAWTISSVASVMFATS